MDDKIKFFDSQSLDAFWNRIKEKFVSAGDTGSAEKEGLAKLYAEVGTNTDGAMTQKAVTEILNTLETTAEAAFHTVFTKL